MPRTKAQQDGLDYEKKFAKALGAEVTPGSGNQWYAKLDVGRKGILVSLKHTGKDALRVTRSILSEAIREARKTGAMPMLGVDIAGEDFVVMRREDFIALVQEEASIARPTKSDAKRARAKQPLILRDED